MDGLRKEALMHTTCNVLTFRLVSKQKSTDDIIWKLWRGRWKVDGRRHSCQEHVWTDEVWGFIKAQWVTKDSNKILFPFLSWWLHGLDLMAPRLFYLWIATHKDNWNNWSILLLQYLQLLTFPKDSLSALLNASGSTCAIANSCWWRLFTLVFVFVLHSTWQRCDWGGWPD